MKIFRAAYRPSARLLLPVLLLLSSGIVQGKQLVYEHIDVKMLTDKIRTALIKTRKVSFIAAEMRKNVAEEYETLLESVVGKN